ncbi:putative palmitoyl-protein thioesterase precursor [Phakopsora pachyrhizi]|uniref:Palmitoyl-protein thioesterase n=1 Tax=Phakopsora pachyrhizi TaxID=170000 RepID=A0AAV0BKL9_PHAPC|nr:putative palmitoyl-protein thioesterase precursor [Phakopsora pachyrhizi]CAH7687145.1 putative palmitoyl-protein thioesterase precursor [Phakopsora pachyrhizi]
MIYLTYIYFLYQIWHGLSDSYQNSGIGRLARWVDDRYPGKKVYLIRMSESGEEDRRATWFGSANEEVTSAYEQISRIKELSDGFDAIGFSQGGQLMRAYVERYNRPRVRNLITLGAQHMGVSGHAPCKNFFDVGCHLVERLIRTGTVYGSYAQNHVIPAQYFRDQSDLAPYLKHNEFLRDINNERFNDTQISIEDHKSDDNDNPPVYEPRNSTYKLNFQSLDNFVMFKFSLDHIVVPPSSAYFTLLDHHSNFIPLKELPIFKEDYIGLKKLNSEGKIHYGVCEGEHMFIDKRCWSEVIDWLRDDEEVLGKQAISQNVFN